MLDVIHPGSRHNYLRASHRLPTVAAAMLLYSKCTPWTELQRFVVLECNFVLSFYHLLIKKVATVMLVRGRLATPCSALLIAFGGREEYARPSLKGCRVGLHDFPKLPLPMGNPGPI